MAEHSRLTASIVRTGGASVVWPLVGSLGTLILLAVVVLTAVVGVAPALQLTQNERRS